jgi:hypothetical protein
MQIGSQPTKNIGNVGLVDENGDYYGIKHVNNKPRISSMPYLYDIVEGNVSGHEAWSKIGFNDDVDNATEDLWPYGGLYTFPAAATKMDLVSSDNNDGKTGAPTSTGARTVKIYGLLSDYSSASETITLDGTTPVTTTNTYLRINNMRVMTAGTGGVPIGNLTLSETGGTTYRYGYIRAGFTRQRQMIYTVPLGKTLYVTDYMISGTNASAGHWCRFTLRSNYDEKSDTVLATTLFMPHFEVQVVDQVVTHQFALPIKFKATSYIRMQVLSDAGAANEICSAALRGWLE